MSDGRKAAAALRRALARRKRRPREVLAISAVTGEGLDEFLDAVAGILYGTSERRRGGAGRRLGKRRVAP